MVDPNEEKSEVRNPNEEESRLVDLNEEESEVKNLNEEKSELVDPNEEKSEVWRNIFQERFDKRTGGNCSKELFFPVLVIFNKLLLFL